IVTADRAGLFIDGRYRVQVRAETDAAVLTPVPWPETATADWLLEALPGGGRVGFDPWLHTRSEIEGLQKRLSTASIALVPIENPVDAIWHDRPDPSGGPVRIHPSDLAGATPQERRARIAAELVAQGQRAAVLT
ncbi:aminopeptidase P family N-terminal domain-containing protein, partial [Rhizobium ruizarguesonis]|uniref:aminopeptidase P family N-terminal domain-containing protein n=1 Tax=Rhizobium ruizarguesonis TaxID=2081791 RepID=UPI0013CA9534